LQAICDGKLYSQAPIFGLIKYPTIEISGAKGKAEKATTEILTE
jgi:hypothetical protein